MLEHIMAAQGPAGGTSLLVSLLPLVVVFGIFYLLIYRPMKTRQSKHEALVGGLKSGDKIITTGGIYATVARVNSDHTLIVKVADQVQMKIAKSAVGSMQSVEAPESNNK